MNKTEIQKNATTGDMVYIKTIEPGLKLFVCKKEGFSKKIGMIGTKYGSIDNDFDDINTGKRIKVPDGIAHFLEHKLFEQEGGNALDLFAEMGVSANAYTSFDHTVYFFETSNKFKKSIEQLFNLVMKPYFTDENVEKEKGIITQEIKMYEDDPASVVYYNTLKAMYIKHTLNIDIAGSEESVSRITKEDLYSCYNTFYSPKNMFCIIIGDVDVNETIKYIEEVYGKYKQNINKQVKRYDVIEPEEVCEKRIEKNLDVYMPYISYGFKIMGQTPEENVKNKIITKIIEEAYFSKMSDFYEEMYNKKIITSPIEVEYDSGKTFSYLIIIGTSKHKENYIKMLNNFILDIKGKGIKRDLFEITKKKLIGQEIYKAEDLMSIHRNVIESVINGLNIFKDIEILKKISIEDVNEFLKYKLNIEKQVISVVDEINKNKK